MNNETISQFLNVVSASATAAINRGEIAVEVQPELLVVLLEDCRKVMALTGENERLKEGIEAATDDLRMIRKDCDANCVHMGEEAKRVYVLLESQIAEPHRLLMGLLEGDDG